MFLTLDLHCFTDFEFPALKFHGLNVKEMDVCGL